MLILTHSQEVRLSRIAAVVLAAGLSRRMGSPKALLPLAGVPMISRVVETIRSVRGIQPIVVVAGYAADAVVAALGGFDVTCIHNPDYAQGEMLSSIKAGVARIQNQCDAFFLVLGDQPLVQPQTYQSLLDAYFNVGCSMLDVRCSIPETDEHRTFNTQHSTSNQILQPTYDGHRGHPILLPASAIEEILSLPADATLKTYTQRTATHHIPVDDPGILTDIDTPGDYAHAIELLAAQPSQRLTVPHPC